MPPLEEILGPWLLGANCRNIARAHGIEEEDVEDTIRDHFNAYLRRRLGHECVEIALSRYSTPSGILN